MGEGGGVGGRLEEEGGGKGGERGRGGGGEERKELERLELAMVAGSEPACPEPRPSAL